MQVDEISWSAETEEKLAAKHRVSMDEVWEVCSSSETHLRRGRGGTYYLFGQTSAGRYLWVCAVPVAGQRNRWRIVTGRDMDETERRLFLEANNR